MNNYKENINSKAILATLLSATAVLAAMGCWFCWHCPSRIYPPESHGLFWRQLVWNGIGVAAFAAAWLAGWKRLLKAAPWLMLAWVLAFIAAQLGPAVRGTHRWVSIGCLRFNVVTFFMPAFALFVTWLHERKWIRSWMEWVFLVAAVVAGVAFVYSSPSLMKRIAAHFWPEGHILDEAYMSSQLQAAFAAARWFGGAGKDLGYLPCPESDGMLSAAALLFGKWFPSAVVALFALAGSCLTALWRGAADAAKRRYVLLYGLWLVFPAAYCLLHSLSFLPVAGMSPAWVGYGGSAVVAAWVGLGGLAAMGREGLSGHGSGIRTERDAGDGNGKGAWGIVSGVWGVIAGLWGVAAIMAVLLIAFAPGRESWMPGRHGGFAEPRPPDIEFGEFGLVAKRGNILAADGSPLAYTERTWRFRLDPNVVENYRPGFPYCPFPDYDVAQGLGIPYEDLRAAYGRKESRYVFLMDAEEGDPAVAYFRNNWRWLTKDGGVISVPLQRRVYPLGRSAAAVVGFVNGFEEDAPTGAGGLERAFDNRLRGENGTYDRKLPIGERREKARPAPGGNLCTTLVPSVQRAVADAVAAACATNGARSAWGIVMEVPSGDIAAMASWPTFEPTGRKREEVWSPAQAANHAAQDCFDPGGLAKPITYAIALDAGVLSEDDTIDQCGGTWEFNGETFRDDITNSVTVAEAIARRVNIAAGKAACLVGPNRLHGALLRFGFGAKTCTVGVPGESYGTSPLRLNAGASTRPRPCAPGWATVSRRPGFRSHRRTPRSPTTGRWCGRAW